MNTVYDFKWSKAEKQVARRAFDAAYEKECRAIGRKVQEMMPDEDPRCIWRIHDYLSKMRRETDEKYDYRYSQLILVFARLLYEGWLGESDLGGLEQDKLERMRDLISYWPR
jgi:hypothetical protein